MDQRRLGLALLIVGIILAVIAVVGLTTGDADDTETVTAPPTSTSTTSSTTTTTTTTTTTVAPAETVESFFVRYVDAFAAGDVDFLHSRLNQATLDRYGADVCRTYLEGVTAPTLEFRAEGSVGPWDYTTDGLTTTIPDATMVDVTFGDGDAAVERTLHWQYVDGRYTWFSDCGDPA